MLRRRASVSKLLLVLAVAVVVRLGVFFAFPSIFDWVRTGRIHGSGTYDAYAKNLLATGVYGLTPGVPDAALPPLYSVVLAGVYAALGRAALPVAMTHIALDVLTIALLYQIGVRLLPQGEAVGALAGLAYACYPYLVFQNLTLNDTALFVALLYAYVLLVVRLRERAAFDPRTGALSVAGGLVLGLAALTRPVALPLAGLLAVWFLFRQSLGQTLARLGLALVVAGAVLSVWTVRNHAVYGAFVPMATNAGSNFWQGNNASTVPYLRAGWDVQWAAPDGSGPSDFRRPEADAGFYRLAFQYLREHPDRIPELLWVKLRTHWSVDVTPRLNPVGGRLPRLDARGHVVLGEGDGSTAAADRPPPDDPIDLYSRPLFDRAGRTLHRVYWGGLLFLALAGGVMTRRWWREVSLVWLVQLGLTLIYVAFHPSTRYRLPGDPLLFLFSAYPLVWLAGRLRQSPD